MVSGDFLSLILTDGELIGANEVMNILCLTITDLHGTKSVYIWRLYERRQRDVQQFSCIWDRPSCGDGNHCVHRCQVCEQICHSCSCMRTSVHSGGLRWHICQYQRQ